MKAKTLQNKFTGLIALPVQVERYWSVKDMLSLVDPLSPTEFGVENFTALVIWIPSKRLFIKQGFTYVCARLNKQEVVLLSHIKFWEGH